MSTNTTTTLSGQYRAYFDRKLLSLAIQELRLNQFAQKAQLPKNSGGKTVTFWKYADASSADVQTLTEGTTPTTTKDLTQTSVTATLVQYGELLVGTDILTSTDMFDWLSNGVNLLGQDAAIKSDDISRDELVSNGTSVYAQGASSWATLAAQAVASAKLIDKDVLDIVTRLKINRARKIGGRYVGVICPQVSSDLQNDPRWVEVNNYASGTRIFNGELGEFRGCRFVEATNPFIEDSTGSEGTHVAGGNIFSTMFLGAEAFGTVALAGDRPMSPRVIVVRGADKYDPLDQTTKAGWKAFYTSRLLNANWCRVYKSKTAFVG